ncbi:MAG: peptidylprolyl isomerase [Arenicella sp.]
MAQATARHILVSSEEACLEIKNNIQNKSISFEDAAKQHSSCPSGQAGGDLGSFGPGMMVPEFDKVCFNEEVGTVHGPVQTQFGYHLVEVTDRSE